MSNLLSFKILSLFVNNLTGSIPSGIFNISSLQSISLSANDLYGNLPMDMCDRIPNLNGLYLSYNQLSGQIPTSLHKCAKLQLISLSYNEFIGSIPKDIGNLSELEVLYLGQNYLTGTIPPSLLGPVCKARIQNGNWKIHSISHSFVFEWLIRMEIWIKKPFSWKPISLLSRFTFLLLTW